MAIQPNPKIRALKEASPEVYEVWMELYRQLKPHCALDDKTKELCYISAMAAARLPGGIPFHIKAAQEAGATRAEVTSALISGLPAVGNCVLEVMPTALEAMDDVFGKAE